MTTSAHPAYRRFLLVGTFLGALAFTPLALQAGPAAAQATQVAPQGVLTPVNTLYNALRQAQTQDSAQRRLAIILPAVDSAFDLPTILRRSIGLHYDDFTPVERQPLQQAFRRFTAARYVSSFTPGSKGVFTVSPRLTLNPAGGYIVHTTVHGEGDQPSDATSIDYIVKNTPTGWRIADILLDGHISQAAAQRSDFGSVIDRKGPAGLTQVLSAKADSILQD
ncbi:hypothetical protein E3E12_05300 [Formicincola oecophyllae]|uniref:Uncharacterized protein n=1 Tax=Formicincola oecophyllae TaxID=2558361 RepID=A0A4Y6UBC5_9PROT|nr:ABC transporter substrate-binding protein [Formicincola oecophyllae]QDH13701.1 hypothetical protein E3E12_05300 [Formicincola oecophyllae]